MSEKVIGGWGEHNGEKPVKLFDGANSFGEIIDLVRSAQPGTLKDSQGVEVNVMNILRIKQLWESAKLVPGAFIGEITKNYGLRQAVVRAMTPNFTGSPNAEYILGWLNFFKIQDEAVRAFYDESGKPLHIMSDSSGNPLDITKTIQNMQDIVNFLQQNSNYDLNIVENYFKTITSNHGLRAALKKALGFAS